MNHVSVQAVCVAVFKFQCLEALLCIISLQAVLSVISASVNTANLVSLHAVIYDCLIFLGSFICL